MWPNPQFPADLITFAEEILSGKLHFLCSESTNSIQTALKDNDVVIIARLCDFGQTLWLFFRKSYVDQILKAGLARDTH